MSDPQPTEPTVPVEADSGIEYTVYDPSPASTAAQAAAGASAGSGSFPIGGAPTPVQGTNVLAVLSLVFAFLFAPAGLVLGLIARKQIARTPKGGKSVATAGIVVSLVTMVVTVLFVVAGVVLAIGRATVPDSTVIGPQAPVPSVAVPTPHLPVPTETAPANVPVPGASGAPMAGDPVVVEQMKADALEMVRAQERYRRQVPSEPGLEVSFSDAPVLVGTTRVTPHNGNVISAMPVPASAGLPEGGYCITVMNDKASEPVMWDSAVGGTGSWLGADLPEDQMAAGACAVQAGE